MNELQQRRLDFFNETVAYYSEDPIGRRAVAIDNDRYQPSITCFYRTEGGRKCAIGRHIPDDKYDSIMEGVSIQGPMIQAALLQEVLALGADFLREVQYFHDREDNWTSTGLSEQGMVAAHQIRQGALPFN